MAGLSAEDRDWVIRTLAGEAGSEPPSGQAAVAAVIKNRLDTGKWGGSAKDVVLAPGQFSMWNNLTGFAGGAGANSVGTRLPAGSTAYRQLGSIVDKIFSGDMKDPTGGALNYYAPSGMPGGKPPSWAASMANPTQIGSQIFGTAGQPSRPVSRTPGVTLNTPVAAAAAPAAPAMGPAPPVANQQQPPLAVFKKAVDDYKRSIGESDGQQQEGPGPNLLGRLPPEARNLSQTAGMAAGRGIGAGQAQQYAQALGIAQPPGMSITSLQDPITWGAQPWGATQGQPFSNYGPQASPYGTSLTSLQNMAQQLAQQDWMAQQAYGTGSYG